MPNRSVAPPIRCHEPKRGHPRLGAPTAVALYLSLSLSAVGCGGGGGTPPSDAGPSSCVTEDSLSDGTHPVDSPWLGLRFIVATGDAANTVAGQVKVTAVATATIPGGWLPLSGQLLDRASYPDLYDAIGTRYGGDGVSTFGLPDARERVVIGTGAGPGLTERTLGELVGVDAVTLTTDDLPPHTHAIADSGETESAGGGTPHSAVRPSLALTAGIQVAGIFPPRNGNWQTGSLGQIDFFLMPDLPSTHLPADGSLLPIASYTALFSLLGTTYGGDGATTFGLPDLRGRAITHQGSAPERFPLALGELYGAETVTPSTAAMGAHAHGTPSGAMTGATGGDEGELGDIQPALAVNAIVLTAGVFPGSSSTPQENNIGDIYFFASTFAPTGNSVFADGQLIPIAGFSAMFALVGTLYGGDGANDFGIPDLRARFALQADTTGADELEPGDTGGDDIPPPNAPHRHTISAANGAAACRTP